MERVENMGKRFTGKVAIVTASTMGIGFSIAERLGLEGASVVVSSRKQKNVDDAVEKLRGKGIEVLGLVCHVSNPQQRKNLIDKTLELKYGKIGTFVSNAAVNPVVNIFTDTVLRIQESVMDKMWEVNVKASILLIKEIAPYLKKGSSIIFISSVSAYHTRPSWCMYAVTKTALIGLTKAVADELGPDTRVNYVAPGIVPTQFASIITKDDALKKYLEEMALLKRLGRAEEIAAATEFLASDDASFITGETLVVAGGISSRL